MLSSSEKNRCCYLSSTAHCHWQSCQRLFILWICQLKMLLPPKPAKASNYYTWKAALLWARELSKNAWQRSCYAKMHHLNSVSSFLKLAELCNCGTELEYLKSLMMAWVQCETFLGPFSTVWKWNFVISRCNLVVVGKPKTQDKV